jgi:hypothetical protein
MASSATAGASTLDRTGKAHIKVFSDDGQPRALRADRASLIISTSTSSYVTSSPVDSLSTLVRGSGARRTSTRSNVPEFFRFMRMLRCF